MSDTLTTLKELAAQVRGATRKGENTAEKIGRIFVGILTLMENSEISLEVTNEDDTLEVLKGLAGQIRDASIDGENTAEKIGRVFVGILNLLERSGIQFEIAESSDSIEVLKTLSLQVRNATNEGENTAEKIGRIFVGILNLLVNFGGDGFLVRSDLPDYYYPSMQTAFNAVRATYPNGLTRNVTISCVKPAKEKRSSGHYIASLSGWNRRSMYMLTIDGKNDLYLNGNALGCLAFSNVDNIVIKNIHFEDFSNYVGYQVPDALGAISFTGKLSQYARNMFVGGCTFNGKSMTDETVMSTNSVILINTENVTINNSSFTDGGGPVVNADTCNLLSILNNDFVLAPVGVGYPTAVTVSGGKILILEDNRMSGDNRYSFVAVTNMDRAYIRRNSFRNGGSMALSVSSSVPMSKLVIESNLFAGMLSNTGSINTWAQAVIGLCPIRDMELNSNTFYMSGNNGQQYCTRWGTINRLEISNNVVVDAGHAVHFIYGFAFDNVSELVSDYNIFQYKLHDNITYGSLLRVFNTEGAGGGVEINADRGCRFWQLQELGYELHSVLVSDGVDADALDDNLMITSALDGGNPANDAYVPDIDLYYKLKSASVNSRGCYNRHGSVIDETAIVPGYTGYNMEDESTFSDAAQYSSMAEDTLLLESKTLDRNRMPMFSIIGSADRYLAIGRYGLFSPVPIVDGDGEYVSDELYDINIV